MSKYIWLVVALVVVVGATAAWRYNLHLTYGERLMLHRSAWTTWR